MSFLGAYSQAGNIVTADAEATWMCTVPELWEGQESEALVRKDMTNDETGELWQYGDRRQELVFIGTKLKYDVRRMPCP